MIFELAPVTFLGKQEELISKRAPETGEWFLHTREFQEWTKSSKKVLWCPGSPGAGKSMLVSIASEELLRCHRNNPKVGIACIYCDYKEGPCVQTPARLLSGLWRQLVWKSGKLAKDVKILHQRKRGQDLTTEEALGILTAACSEFDTVFVIVDALDECSHRTSGNEDESVSRRDRLLDALKRLHESNHVSLMLTSRPGVSVIHKFQSAQTLQIKATEEDISKYVTSRIEMAGRFLPVVRTSMGLEHLIRSTVVEKAGGMFFMAEIQMDEVLRKRDARGVRSTLQSLPTKYHEYYNWTMDRIKAQDEEDREIAGQVLDLVAFSKRKLAWTELEQALAVQPGDTEIVTDGYKDAEILIAACMGLVKRSSEANGIQASSEGLQLVHPSAKDYFESLPPENVRAAHLAIARICVQFLSFDVFASGPCHTGYEVWLRLKNHPFVWYAAHYWGDHVRRSESEELDDAIVSLLQQPLKVSALVQFMLPAEEILQLDPKYWSTISDTSDQSPSGVPGLHVAARLGLTSVMRKLLVLGADQNSATALCSRRDGHGRQAVYWAVRGNQEATLRLLLNSGADINDSGDFENYQKWSIRKSEETNDEIDWVDWDVRKRSALHLAILQRNAALAEVILEAGADVENVNGLRLRPFELAIEHLPNSTAISLLAHGARIWLPGESGRGIATIASIFVKVLTDLMLQILRRDLSISENDAHGCIMMLWTTEGYLNKTAQRFQEWQGTFQEWRGTFQEWQDIDRTGWPPAQFPQIWVNPFCGISPDTWQAILLAACETEDGEMVQWLLAHSQASLCTINLRQWTIVHLAASSSDLVLDFLILNNANLQARDHEGHTVLHHSAKKNNIHLVELAVTRGRIPVNARTQTKATPLHLAVGSLRVLEYLISHGADINAVDDSGRTPLYYSLESESAMGVLISHGATTDTFDSDGMALICHAVRVDSFSDVTQASLRLRCLLQAGAEVNFKGSNGMAAIHTAASQGHCSLIQLLLENGADPTMEDFEHRTPLALLESSENASMSKSLLLSALRTRTSMRRTSNFSHRHQRR